MKTIKKLISRILILFAVCICSSCSACKSFGYREEVSSIEEFVAFINGTVEKVTGTCLTRYEMGEKLMRYEEIQKRWTGYGIEEKTYGWKTKGRMADVPELKLITPGEHEHDENTRYEITMLEKDENGFCTGIKVSVMPEGACKVDESPTPEAVITPEPEEEPVYVWCLVDTEVVRHENENGEVHKTSYDASELTHSCIMRGTVEIPEHKTVTSSFSASCSAPPKTVKPGEEAVLYLQMTMENDNDVYHYGAGASVCFGKPGGLKTFWEAVQSGENNDCHMDAIGDWDNPPVRRPNASVKGTFPDTANEGQRLDVTFDACGSQTYWTYELQETKESGQTEARG